MSGNIAPDGRAKRLCSFPLVRTGTLAVPTLGEFANAKSKEETQQTAVPGGLCLSASCFDLAAAARRDCAHDHEHGVLDLSLGGPRNLNKPERQPKKQKCSGESQQKGAGSTQQRWSIFVASVVSTKTQFSLSLSRTRVDHAAKEDPVLTVSFATSSPE